MIALRKAFMTLLVVLLASQGVERAAIGKATSLWAVATDHRADIITLGIVGCAMVMMVSGDVGRWLGRAALLLWVGITWAILLKG